MVVDKETAAVLHNYTTPKEFPKRRPTELDEYMNQDQNADKMNASKTEDEKARLEKATDHKTFRVKFSNLENTKPLIPTLKNTEVPAKKGWTDINLEELTKIKQTWSNVFAPGSVEIKALKQFIEKKKLCQIEFTNGIVTGPEEFLEKIN